MASRSEPLHVLIGYRIGSRRHPLFDGAGAAASDEARWNTRGRHVIYASEHYATAVLEIAAQANALRLPRTLAYIAIEAPAGTAIEDVTPELLPGWADEDKRASRDFGDRWYDQRRSVVLRVPSLAAPGIERNILMHGRHPDFPSLRASLAKPIVLHPRLAV